MSGGICGISIHSSQKQVSSYQPNYYLPLLLDPQNCLCETPTPFFTCICIESLFIVWDNGANALFNTSSWFIPLFCWYLVLRFFIFLWRDHYFLMVLTQSSIQVLQKTTYFLICLYIKQKELLLTVYI